MKRFDLRIARHCCFDTPCFSAVCQPLVDCFLALRDSSRAIMVNLSETWLRGYQVCYGRIIIGRMDFDENRKSCG
jgi:hypothetical protein